MNIQDIMTYIEENKNKKVINIQENLNKMLNELTIVNRLGRTFLVDDNNKVYAIFCYYHKQWELLSKVEYGSKVSSSHGYNTMCKIGVREWTRQQKELKLLGNEVLSQLESGSLTIEQVSDYKEKRTLEIKTINLETKPKGYASQDDIFKDVVEEPVNEEVVEEPVIEE